MIVIKKMFLEQRFDVKKRKCEKRKTIVVDEGDRRG